MNTSFFLKKKLATTQAIVRFFGVGVILFKFCTLVVIPKMNDIYTNPQLPYCYVVKLVSIVLRHCSLCTVKKFIDVKIKALNLININYFV